MTIQTLAVKPLAAGERAMSYRQDALTELLNGVRSAAELGAPLAALQNLEELTHQVYWSPATIRVGDSDERKTGRSSSPSEN